MLQKVSLKNRYIYIYILVPICACCVSTCRRRCVRRNWQVIIDCFSLAALSSRMLFNHAPAGTPHVADERRFGLLVFKAGSVTSLGSVPIRLRFAFLRILIVIYE